MNRPSIEPGKEKIVSIRANALPAVITMPSRLSRAEGRGTAVLQMPGHFARAMRKAPVVVSMPSRSACTSLRSSRVVEMPNRISDPEEGSETRILEFGKRKPGGLSLSEGLRMTLVALFALFGWPRPWHGKDPGAAGARPWKLEILNAISKLQLPSTAAAPARAGTIEFPQAAAEEPMLEADLASAA